MVRKTGSSAEGAGGNVKRYQSFMDQMSYDQSDWREKATCSRLPPEWFEYEGAASKPLLTEGAKTCGSCPARRECLEEASPSDMYWTTRGGKLPAAFHTTTQPSVGRPPKDPGFGQPEKPCARGHYNRWSRDHRGMLRCKECERLRAACKREGKTLPPAPRVSPEGKCAKGHNDWFRNAKGFRECRECRKIRSRNRHHAAKAAKMGE